MSPRKNRRLTGFVTFMGLLVAAVMITQFSVTRVPAQTTQPKITGKVTITTIKAFDAAGLPGLVSIQYRRFSASPGAKIENFIFADHAELCIPEKGSITVTLPNGSKLRVKKGDIFTIPLGANFKLVEFDKRLGWEDLCWFLNVK